MAYVNAYRNDVFVSYAHVDDRALPGAGTGWVCTLVDALKIVLAEQLGRAEVLAVWRDLQLAGNVSVSEEVLAAVRDSALLLVVLSEGYLASEWCDAERSGFLDLAGAATRRLFMVERMPIERARKPAVFQDRKGYPFWQREHDDSPAHTLGVPAPTAAQPAYYQRLNTLGIELANELKRMRRAASG
ncbi:MAG TPA: TIR domain-containing protein [Polyangiales bacterium]|nr:TIR domain-containing protein [Polyangiales bacterium]